MYGSCGLAGYFCVGYEVRFAPGTGSAYRFVYKVDPRDGKYVADAESAPGLPVLERVRHSLASYRRRKVEAKSKSVRGNGDVERSESSLFVLYNVSAGG